MGESRGCADKLGKTATFRSHLETGELDEWGRTCASCDGKRGHSCENGEAAALRDHNSTGEFNVHGSTFAMSGGKYGPPDVDGCEASFRPPIHTLDPKDGHVWMNHGGSTASCDEFHGG